MKTDLVAGVRKHLRDHVPRGASLVVGLSGGIDSVVLLHLLARGLRLPPRRLSAIHVNHQLNPQAPGWASFCRRLCRQLGIRLRVVKVEVKRGNSTEGAARSARYAAFAASGADVVMLAHNRDDQSETVLLQLFRGAGPRGLAAMPVFREGVPGTPAVLRPLLEVPRSLISDYAARHSLQWVEDDSNDDRRYLRNFLRHELMPLIEARRPGTRAVLARGARLQAEASDLLDALALQDLGGSLPPGRLDLALLESLPAHRARNALRFFLRGNGLPMPDADRLEELLRQALTAGRDAAVCMPLGTSDLRRFRNALHIVKQLALPDRKFAVHWSGRGVLRLAPLAGSLQMQPATAGGIDGALIRSSGLLVASRRGGETLRLALGGRQRTVRKLLQEADCPPWMRERLPFLYIEGQLAAVPGLGVDVRFQAPAGKGGYLPVWRPD